VRWAGAGDSGVRLGEDPFLDRLLPAFFEIDGLGTEAAVAFRDPGVPREDREPWLPAVVRVLLERGPSTVPWSWARRSTGSGTAAGQRASVLLHEALRPTLDELTARVTDYARMLPRGPSTVAALPSVPCGRSTTPAGSIWRSCSR
jgi:hypothetical protein